MHVSFVAYSMRQAVRRAQRRPCCLAGTSESITSDRQCSSHYRLIRCDSAASLPLFLHLARPLACPRSLSLFSISTFLSTALSGSFHMQSLSLRISSFSISPSQFFLSPHPFQALTLPLVFSQFPFFSLPLPTLPLPISTPTPDFMSVLKLCC